MGMDASELQNFRDRQAGVSEKNGVKTESVIKMFADAEKIAAIKATVEIVRIGNPPTDVVIRPLNPRMGVEAYRILRNTLMPIINLYRLNESKGGINFVQILDAFGDNVNDIPKLIHLILQRGNPEISEDWVKDNFDLVADLMTIIPPFMRQNLFDLMFSPKAPAQQPQPSQPSASVTVTEATPSEPLTAV